MTPMMIWDFENGENLHDDLNRLRTDSTFHDVTFICADDVKLRACRGLLAARCRVFRAKLNPQPGVFPKTVDMGTITSQALEVVLTFIHTETINDSVSPKVLIEAYRAAVELGLPKLQCMIPQQLQWKSTGDLSTASSLLNKAVVELPPSDSDAEIYKVLLMPFCTSALAIGQLNDLSQRALELFLKRTRSLETVFKTPEHILLLCVIEWAWAQDVPPATGRYATLKCLETAVDGIASDDVKVTLANELARGSLKLMIRYMDLVLICPHRLKFLASAVDILADASPLSSASLHHACANTKCPPGHPSKIRGKPEIRGFRWFWEKQES